MRPCRGLRVVLDGECHQFPVPAQFEALDDVVVEARVRDAGLPELGVHHPVQGGIDGEPVVL